MNTKIKNLQYMLGDFVSSNKKTIICCLSLFLVGLVVGIVYTVSANGGEFEKISRSDMDFGAVKVFFYSSLLVAIGYFAVAIASVVRGLNFIAALPFPILGFIFGDYTTMLIGSYGGMGICNLLFVYMPFFLLTFGILTASSCVALRLSDVCECRKGALLRPSVSAVLKGYGINIVVNFVIFLIIGGIVKVIVVS